MEKIKNIQKNSKSVSEKIQESVKNMQKNSNIKEVQDMQPNIREQFQESSKPTNERLLEIYDAKNQWLWKEVEQWYRKTGKGIRFVFSWLTWQTLEMAQPAICAHELLNQNDDKFVPSSSQNKYCPTEVKHFSKLPSMLLNWYFKFLLGIFIFYLRLENETRPIGISTIIWKHWL